LLTDAERHALIHDWNQTRIDYPKDKRIAELFEQQVEKTPDNIALAFEDRKLSYRELNSRANQLAHHLIDLGVGPDVVVAICVERSLEMIVGLLGILKAGGAYVPLDAGYSKARLAFMLDDSQTRVLITRQYLLGTLPPHSAALVDLDADRDFIATQSDANPFGHANAANLAYVMYTSGSTGRPKGVAMPHGALVNLLSWHLQDPVLSRPAKTLQFASLSFDVSFQEAFSTWCSGGTLVLISEELRRDAGALLTLMQEQAIDRLFLPFVALQHLAEQADGCEPVPASLHEVITAGEQLRITPQVARFFDRLPECTLHNHYGPSETHVVTSFALTGHPSSWCLLPPIGRPIANTQVYILDAYLNPVPVGVRGEIHIGGAGLARGYLNRPELTAEKFIANPFSEDPDARLYKTGDLARYLPDGNIEFLGRTDHQVKIRGFRIELG
ncbi:MAG: non-ribosomal peptide synthetase, partial [Pyrinomonadaceae bacterium]